MVTRSTSASDAKKDAAAPAGPASEARPRRLRRFRRWAATEKVLIVCFVVAFAAHLPALPISRYVGQLLDFWSDDESEDDEPAVVPFEIEIGADLPDPPKVKAEEKKAEEPPKPKPEPEPTAAPPEPSVPPPVVTAPPPPAPKPKRESPADAIDDIQVLAKNPNHVTITLVGSQLRNHPVGGKMGALLTANKQWEDFFGGSNIDPINDVDVMVVTGPRMKISGKVVSIVKFSADMERVKAAVDHVISESKTGGEWLEGTTIPAARAFADGAERIFALVPDKSLLYVFPSPYPGPAKQKRLKKQGKLDEAMQKARKTLDLELGKIKAGKFADRDLPQFAIEAYMVEPWKLQGKDGKVDLPLVGGIELIPKDLDQGRIVVVPSGADADVTITLVAPTEKAAVDDAQILNASWGTIQMGARFKFDLELPDMKFEPKGNEIVAKGKLDQKALEVVFTIGKEKTEEAKKTRKDEPDDEG